MTALLALIILASPASAMEQAWVFDQLSDAIVRKAVEANGDKVVAGKHPTYGIDAKNGIDYMIEVDGCVSSERCQGLSMLACFKKDPTITLEMVNAYNRGAYFGRAVMKEDELCYYSYAITNGGVTQEFLNQNISVFNANTADFVSRMESKRPKR